MASDAVFVWSLSIEKYISIDPVLSGKELCRIALLSIGTTLLLSARSRRLENAIPLQVFSFDLCVCLMIQPFPDGFNRLQR